MNKVFIAAALTALTPATAHAAAFTNGSFETASVDPADGFLTLTTGSTAIEGWTVLGNSIDYIGGYWEAADGRRSIDLNGNASGGIQQTFDTVVGRRYVVTFALAGNPDDAPAQKLMSTVATGNASTSYTFDTTGRTRTDMGWTPFQYRFTADGGTTTLSFTSGQGGAFGAALDLVSVAAVPEPATWGLMILGFGAIGGAMRRRTAAAARMRLA